MGNARAASLFTCVLLLAGCAAGPEPSAAPPGTSPAAARPAEAVQIALIRDYMGADCRGTGGDLFAGGGGLRIQRLNLTCDGVAVTGTVEGLRAGYSDFESSCTYFRAGVDGAVGAADGVPCVERLSYGDCVWGPGFRIQRVERAVTDGNRRIVARRWYDQPVVYCDSPAAEAVNGYFEAECGTFMEEADGFWAEAAEVIAGRGAEGFADYPLRETVTTELTYLDEDLLSVRKTRNWFMGGTSPIDCSGDTFDLHTGERLSLDRFVALDIAGFNEWVTEEVCGLGWAREAVEGYYSGLAFADYQYAYDGGNVLIFLEEPFVAGGAPVLRYPL